MGAQVSGNRLKSPLLLWVGWTLPVVLCLVTSWGLLLAGAWIFVFARAAGISAGTMGWRLGDRAGRLAGIALVAGVAAWALVHYITIPLAEFLTGSGVDLSLLAGRIESLDGDWSRFLLWLGVSWLSAAVLEEAVFRGFFIGYGTQLFGTRATPLLVLGSAISFGMMHARQGPAGMVQAGLLGLVLAVGFVVGGGRLLVPVLMHGTVNTIYFAGAFLGLLSLD